MYMCTGTGIFILQKLQCQMGWGQGARPLLQGFRHQAVADRSVFFSLFNYPVNRPFAWIKAGRVTAEEFYAWSEKAREKKAECDGRKITLEEYQQWLKDS